MELHRLIQVLSGSISWLAMKHRKICWRSLLYLKHITQQLNIELRFLKCLFFLLTKNKDSEHFFIRASMIIICRASLLASKLSWKILLMTFRGFRTPSIPKIILKQPKVSYKNWVSSLSKTSSWTNLKWKISFQCRKISSKNWVWGLSYQSRSFLDWMT